MNERGLWIRAYERKKILGLIPKKVETAVPQGLEAGKNRAETPGGEYR